MTENAVHASPAATTKAPVATTKAPEGRTTAPTEMGYPPKEPGFGERHRRGYILAVVIGALMAILAPLQTNFIPFWPRLAYWQILMLSGATIGLGVTEMVERWGRLRRWPWIEVPVIGVLIALPLTLIVMGAGAMFFGTQGTGVFRFSFNFGVTALISVAITALSHVIHTSNRPAIASIVEALPSTVEPATENSRFTQRLPLPLRSQQVIALQAEDHYLRVHLAGGESTLILMRLSDAIAELSADQGAQTHRSWWVARESVRNVTKADGRATLTLDGGVEAPVSRSFYKALNDAGWLS